MYDSTFNHANLAIAINDDYNIGFDHDVINVAINNCSFCTYSYSMDCKGNGNLLPTVWIASSNFTNNPDSAVNAEYCNIVLKKNCSFFDNSMSVIHIRCGTVNMTGPIVFRNNTVHLHTSPKVDSYGGAISLWSSNMSVVEGPIKFYSNAADYGGAIYICKSCSIRTNVTDLEFYNNSARFYGGALYIECSICNNERSILFYYNLLVGACYASSNAAKLGGNLTFFSVYNDTNCRAHNIPHENGTLFATQPCKIQSSHEARVKANFTNDPYNFHFWLHDLHFILP